MGNRRLSLNALLARVSKSDRGIERDATLERFVATDLKVAE